MGKSKNRTDLLAAGRETLQKFRQKDNKGSNNKSSSKASKRNASASAATESGATSQNVADSDKSTLHAEDTTALLDSSSRVDSVSIDTAASTDEFPAKANSLETSSRTVTVELQSEGSGMDEMSLNLNANEGYDIDPEFPQKGGSSISEDEHLNMPGSSDPIVQVEKSADSSNHMLQPVDFSSQMERQHREEQVTDVGLMQEVGSGSWIQIDKGGVTQIDGYDSLPKEEGATHVVAQLSKPEDASLTDVAITDPEDVHERSDHSGASYPSVEPEMVNIVMTDRQRECISASLCNEEKAGLLNVSNGYEGNQSISGVNDEERSLDFKTGNTEKPLGLKQMDLSSGLKDGSIELSRLAEIIEVLEEDEFRFLFMSRKPSSGEFTDASKMKDSDSLVRDAFERLREQLYVTTLSKDTIDLELSEHQNLIDEISVANSLLHEVRMNNELLSEENAQCRYELQEVVCVRKELEKQLHFSKTEVDLLSAEIKELQNKLEITKGDMTSLSIELVDCRSLVETLQTQNESLNVSLKVMSEEKDKLLNENEVVLLENVKMKGGLAQCKASLDSLQKEQVDLKNDLTSLRDDKMRLEEKNVYIVQENSNLLADLEEYKIELIALRLENKNLNDTVTSVLEERKKLAEEKQLMVNQTEELSNELIDCKDLVLTLQREISNLNNGLKSIAEDRDRFKEEKEKLFIEYDKKSYELSEIKVSEVEWHAERIKALDDKKEATFHISQLAEETELLKSNLDIFKSKVEEFDQKKYSAEFAEVAICSGESKFPTLQNLKSDLSSMDQLQLGVYDDCSGLVALKRHLENAGLVIQNLENSIEGMHLHSISLSRSSDKSIGSGVSKLIHAFESKSNTDDQDTEAPPSETQTTDDPYVTTKTVIQKLGALLNDMVMDAENACEFYKKLMQSKVLADADRTGLRSNYDTLGDYADQLEESNIEFMVFCEVMRENISHIANKESDLLILCDALQKQELVLKSENCQLSEKINDFRVKISELQSQLDEKFREGEEMVISISDQLETLQTEVATRESILEEEWNSFVAQVLQTVGELDTAVETFLPNSAGGTSKNFDILSRMASSISGATKVIEDLHRQLEAAQRDRQAVSDAYDDMHEKSSNLQVKNEMASDLLHRLYCEIRELLNCSGITENVLLDEKILDLLHSDAFDSLLDQLKKFLGGRLELESANEQLNSELINRARDIDELEKQCLKADAVMKLVEDIEQYMKKNGIEIYTHDEPVSHLESLIYLLFQKYKEAVQSSSLSTSLETQLSDLRGQVEHLNSILLQHENENLVFKHSLKSAEEDVVYLKSKVQEKAAELEQSEQRVASLREKLSIAVTKGKGLISQRDSLKQSLAETSRELEKYSQDLLSKNASFHELETKLEVYAEAGERMEALESELSYIRNSATALRESFLLKDSVLQRIEEILEDLELPEHFHSRDIIEKIDWLAKSATGNSMPLNEWDLRSLAGGGTYSDAGYLGVEGVKEDIMPNSNSSDDLRRRCEELESKFYGLAEQNEMLEQSLMERNNLVQRWEEILDRVDIPSTLRSLEPENKIQWLESALLEAQDKCSSLQQKIANLESFCGSLTTDMEDSRRRTSELEASFQQAFVEKEILSRDLDILRHDKDENSKKTAESQRTSEIEAAFHQACVEKDILSRDLEILRHDKDEDSKKTADVQIRIENFENEVNMLQEQRLHIEEHMHHNEGILRRLQELVMDALNNSCSEDGVFGQEGVNNIEEMLRKLVEKYKALSSVEHDPIDVHVTGKSEPSDIPRNSEELGVATMSKKLDDSMAELIFLKEEKDHYMLNNQSLLQEVEALKIKNNEVQQVLNQEEHKSASLREKLNVAVRKGKSLVQQRDGMKQEIEKLNAEVERLKSETKNTETAISEYEERIKVLSIFQERVQAVESENMLLTDRLAEIEHCLQEKEGSWSNILGALGDIDVGLALNSGNPVQKLKEMDKYLHDVRFSLDSAELESKKSKRAAELLLAELNEVQERNDGLQEELAKASHELSEVLRERDFAEHAKCKALSHVEKLYALSEEKERQLSDFMVFKSGVDQIREDLFATEKELSDVLSKDLEVLHSAEEMMESFLESRTTPDFDVPFPHGFPSSFTSRKSENKIFMTEIVSLRERLDNHSRLLHEEACSLFEVVRNVYREYNSKKESYESLTREVNRLEAIEKAKELELHTLRGNISLLYENCGSAILEIENWKNHVVGNAFASKSPERYFKSQMSTEYGHSFVNDMQMYTQEGIRGMSDKLLFVVKDLMSMQSELMEDGQMEMKNTLVNLHKELQEKDIQRERISIELVNQIKEAETNANNYLHDLQQVRGALHDLQSQVDVMKQERVVLEQRLNELNDRETNSNDLQQQVNSLTDALAAKDQEIEALMQALDDEEVQIEHLTNKIGKLENELQQKNQDLENLETSRAKALKKLSVTVSKFDELHGLSESFLSEVEKLQSQLQERDGEISFLRQEVTRCTNDALSVTQISKKRSSDEIHDFLTWLDSLISRVEVRDGTSDDAKYHQGNEYKETLQKQILALVSEFENLRTVAENSDMLLQQERSKVEEYSKKEQFLENSLREKESQIVMLQNAGDSVKPTTSTSEIVEAEQMKNNWAPPGPIAQQVRSLRKTYNDQVAIAIDMDHINDRLEDDDDDKAHGFKSLTTSKIVPRFTRPISDMVDGLWVSCDRALMRQPALRLGVILYWAMMHALLAAFVV